MKWPRSARLRRTVLMLGVAGATAGAALLTPTSAQAVTGSQPGKLILTPPSGATSLSPTVSTTDGCPAGYQGSAVVFALNTDGSIGSRISTVAYGVVSGFSTTLDGAVGALISLGTNVKHGGTDQWVMGCYSGRGGTGRVDYAQSTSVTLSADGKSYTSTSSGTGTTQSVSWTLIGLLILLAAAVAVGAWLALRWRLRRQSADQVTVAEYSRVLAEKTTRDSGKPAQGKA